MSNSILSERDCNVKEKCRKIPKKTVIYARYSSDNQRSESIDEQVRACQYYAEQYNYNIVDVFKDEATSGYHRVQRDGFDALMQAAENHEFEAVIVYELSRFSRRASDALVNIDKLEMLGIEFVSVRETLSSTPEGRLMLHVITGMNEFYSAHLAIETMRGLKENAYNGKSTGGKPPLGYDLDADKKYIINPLEAQTVRMIFDMYLSGSGYNSICKTLNEQGKTTKTGGAFKKNSLYDLLRNEKYTGTMTYNVTSTPKNGKKNRHKYNSDDEIIRTENAHEPIITKEEYNQVLKIMKTRQHKGAQFGAKYDYLLSGKLYCGYCGKAMHGETRHRKGHTYTYYCCPDRQAGICTKKHEKAETLEMNVINSLNNRYFTPKVIDRVAKKMYELRQNSGNKNTVKLLREQQKEIQRKINNGTKVLLDGFDCDTLREQVEELQKQKKNIDRQILDLETASISEGESVDEIKANLKKLYDLGKLSREHQKEIIQKLVGRIYVFDDDTAPDDDYKRLKIVLAPTSAARDALDALTAKYTTPSDMLSELNGSDPVEPVIFVIFNIFILV